MLPKARVEFLTACLDALQLRFVRVDDLFFFYEARPFLASDTAVCAT
jgi:hypothetical protein